MRALLTTVIATACLLASAQARFEGSADADRQTAEPFREAMDLPFDAPGPVPPQNGQPDFPPPPNAYAFPKPPENSNIPPPPPYNAASIRQEESEDSSGRQNIPQTPQNTDEVKTASETAPDDGEADASANPDAKPEAPKIAEDLTKFPPELKKLFERNPFGASIGVSGAGASGASQTPKGLNLHSIYCVDGKWYFSIRDVSLKKDYVVMLGGKTDSLCPYAVDFYDEETNSISVTSNLNSFVMTLKTPDEPKGAPTPPPPPPHEQKNTKTKDRVKNAPKR